VGSSGRHSAEFFLFIGNALPAAETGSRRESRKDSVEVEIEGLLVRQSTKMSIAMFGEGVAGVNEKMNPPRQLTFPELVI
jgi:hypothetical protein